MLTFKYARKSIIVPDESLFVPYATFFAGEYDFLKINKNDAVLDVGANIGDFTLLASLKAKKVIAIEPNPDTFAVLLKNVASLANVTLINKAVGDSHRFVRVEGDGVSARIADDSKGGIEMDRIDNILVPLSVSQTILRMDVEGSEFNALKEERFLSHVRKAVIETHSSELTHLCEDLLKRKGFNTRYVTTFSVAARTMKNILKHPHSFLSYENETGFYALKSVYGFLRSGANPVSSCRGHELKLIQAWK